MSYTKKSFDIIDKKASNKSKKLANKAAKAFSQLLYTSSEAKVKKAMNARKDYLDFIYGKDYLSFVYDIDWKLTSKKGGF